MSRWQAGKCKGCSKNLLHDTDLCLMAVEACITNSYSPEERAAISRYSAEKESLQAAKHFSSTLGQTVNESTAQRLNGEHLLKVHTTVTVNLKKAASDNTIS